jgi:hypothetical protein
MPHHSARLRIRIVENAVDRMMMLRRMTRRPHPRGRHDERENEPRNESAEGESYRIRPNRRDEREREQAE